MLTTLVTHFFLKNPHFMAGFSFAFAGKKKKENDILSTWAGRLQFNIDDDADKHHYDK